MSETLAQEADRLRTIINNARYGLKMPHDPDCEKCGGLGVVHHEHGYSDCNCDDVYKAAMKRHEDHLAAKARERVLFEEEHGHTYGSPCRDDCPVPF